MLQKKLLPAFASFLLVLSACSTQSPLTSVDMKGSVEFSNSVQSQNSGLIEKASSNNADQVLQKMYENNLNNPNLNPVMDSSKGYRHLKIENTNGFSTKAVSGIVTAEEHSVVVTVSGKRYALSKSFLDKLRTILKMYSPKQTAGTGVIKVSDEIALTATLTGADALGSILTTKAFDKLGAASGATVAALTTGTPPIGDKYGFMSEYTNSADEASFVTLLKTFSSAEMPNYLNSALITNDNTPGDTAVFPAAGDNTIKIVVNTVGVNNAFFKRVDLMLFGSSASTNYPLASADAAQPDSGTDAYVLSAAEITNLNATKYDAATGDNFATGIVPTTADKSLVSSIVAKNPKASSVILLDENNDIVSRDVNLYYEDGATIGSTIAEFMDDFTITNRIAQSFATTHAPTSASFAFPAAGSNLSAAASALAAKVYSSSGYTAANITSLTGANGTDVDPTADFVDAHAVMMGLHLDAVTNAGVQAKFAGYTFATSAATTNALATATELGGTSGLNFDSLLSDLGVTTSTNAVRINKTTATSLKFKGNIEAFLATGVTAGPTGKVIFLPTTRTATGSLTVGTAAPTVSTHYVALFAAVNPTGGYVYSIYDPGYNNDQGAAFYDIGTSSVPSTFLTAIFNFGGAGLLGVKF